jgi:hypothetical protein
MTAEEAISGFQALSRQFRKGYTWGELDTVWPELLECSNQALVRVVGILKKNGRTLPSPGYVLKQVLWWEMNLAPRVESERAKRPGADPDSEGREALQLMKARHSGEITEAEYVSRLYQMSERYGRPGYADQARDIKNRVKR